MTSVTATADPTVQDWRDRSARLYRDLWRPARAMVRRAFPRLFGDDEVEDIYGNAWLGTLRALEKRHAGLTDEEIRSYVLTAVANHASKELRRRSRKPISPLDDAAVVPDGGQAPDERVASHEDAQVTRDLLASLPPRRRAVMLFRYGWGLEPNQVCGLVKGLSPRAYRKEITRGVDELTEKLRLVHDGDWCAEREPILKAFAAGLADDDEARQARQHLAHCRGCTELVGRLSDQLHDLGSAIALTGAAAAVDHAGRSLTERTVGALGDLRETAVGLMGRSEAIDAGAAGPLAGTGRGVGAGGAGVLAKLASTGAGAKLAVACLAGGAAATACVAAGIGPIGQPRPGAAERAAVSPAPSVQRSDFHPVRPVLDAGDGEPASSDEPAPEPVVDEEAAPEQPVAEPVALPPAEEQEFGVISGAGAEPAGGGESSAKGSATASEFGP